VTNRLVSKAEFARIAGVTNGAITKLLKTQLKNTMVGKRIDVNHAKAVKYIKDKADAMTTEPATGIDPLYEYAVEYCQSKKKISISALQRKLRVGYNRAKRIADMMVLAGVDIDGTKSPATPKKKSAHVVKGHNAAKNKKEAESLSELKEEIESGSMVHDIPEDLDDFVDMTLREILQRFGTKTAFLDWLKATKSIEDINEKRLKNAQTRGELVNRDLVKLGVIEPFDTAFNKLLTDGAKTIARRVCAMNGAGRSVADCETFVADQISSFIRPAKAKINRALKKRIKV